MDTPTKRCTRCGQIKPITEFYPCKNHGKPSHRGMCKPCMSEWCKEHPISQSAKEHRNQYKREHYDKEKVSATNRLRYRKNPERYKARSLNYYHSNREAIRQKRRQRWADNRDELNEQQRQRHNTPKFRATRQRWFAKNREKMREYDRQRRKNNPERRLAEKQRHRARRYNLPASFTAHNWQQALDYFNGCCAYCGSQQGFWNRIEADHFIPVIASNCPGTVPENMIPACKSCNSRKSKSDPVEWLTREYGPRKAAQILKRINAYFDWLKTHK